MAERNDKKQQDVSVQAMPETMAQPAPEYPEADAAPAPERAGAAKGGQGASRPAPGETVREQEAMNAQVRGERRRWLLIQADASDTTPVFVGVNGFHLSLKRNEPVLVPESVIRVLRDATTCRIETGADGRSRLSATRVPRFAFTVADRREDLTGA